MSRYRIQYTDRAQTSLNAMPSQLRNRFEAGMRQLAADPYGQGSAPAKGQKEADRRTATVAGVIVVYMVSRGVLVVTAVQLIY